MTTLHLVLDDVTAAALREIVGALSARAPGVKISLSAAARHAITETARSIERKRTNQNDMRSRARAELARLKAGT